MFADQVLHIINDVLDFSKLESGHLQLDLIEFNIYRAIDDIIDLLMSIEEATNDAFTALDTHKRDELGIEMWDLQDTLPANEIHFTIIILFLKRFLSSFFTRRHSLTSWMVASLWDGEADGGGATK